MKPPSLKKAKELRLKLGSQQAVAEMINKEFTDISMYTIKQYEIGRRKIPRYYVYFLKILVDRAVNEY